MFKPIHCRPAAGRHAVRAGALLYGAWLSTALFTPALADDAGGQGLSPEQSQTLIKNLQDLAKADSSQAEMEQGFAIASTFADIGGQPEVGFAISGLQQLVQFSGIFSSGSENATSTAIAALTKDVAQIRSDLEKLNSTVTNNAKVQVAQYNQGLLKNIYDANQKLNDIAAQMYPAQAPGSAVRNSASLCRLNNTCAPAAEPVVTEAVLEPLAGVMNEFVNQQANYFVGDDLDTGGNVRQGFKPQPALNVYLASVRMYLGAIVVYAHGNPSVILNDRGTAQRKPFVQDLKRHLAFLRAQAAGGSNPVGAPPQDQITSAIQCTWSSYGSGKGSQYPDATGQCVAAGAVCADDISRRKTAYGRHDIKGIDLYVTWQQDRNSFCSPPTGAPVDALLEVLRAKYGLPAMNGTAALVARMVTTGSLSTGALNPGTLGGSGGVQGASFFVYGTGAQGAVKLYSSAPGGGLAKPLPEGFIPEATALLPGGGSVFYALTKDGTLNWYRFLTGNPNQKPFEGPVAIGSNLIGYKTMFGGGDGVIYAIRNDGSLVWFRHNGFTNGTGSLSAPKVINAGWGGFKDVLSAGHGVIYAIRKDGGLVWYRHRDFLTGDSVDTQPPAPPTAPGTTIHNSPHNGLLVRAEKNRVNTLPSAHFDGPIDVGTGWADFKRVLPAGDGVLLALRSNGQFDWYRHQDYLTGTSTSGTAAAPGAVLNGTAPVNPSVWGSPGAAAGAAARPFGGGARSPFAEVGAGDPATTFGANRNRALPPVAPVPGATNALGAIRNMPGGAGSPPVAATRSDTVIKNARDVVGTPHWDGPRTVDAHTDLGALNTLAASLPATDLGSTNGIH